MRRMISNNVICVKDGKVGTMVTVEPGVEILMNAPKQNGVIATGITKVIEDDAFWTEGGPHPTGIHDGDVFYSSEFDMVVAQLDGTIYRAGSPRGENPVAYGDNITIVQPDVAVARPGGKVFKAFVLED